MTSRQEAARYTFGVLRSAQLWMCGRCALEWLEAHAPMCPLLNPQAAETAALHIYRQVDYGLYRDVPRVRGHGSLIPKTGQSVQINLKAMSSSEVEKGRQATILIVEDDPEQVRLYGKILRGHRLHVRSRASTAVKELESIRPDLVILDHMLAGGESGLEFLRRFKELAAHVPVVVISGTLDVGSQLEALQGPLSAHYVLEKPVRLEQFEAVVSEALAHCGLGEVVAQLKSLERLEKDFTTEPERRYTDRLTRQHDLLNHLRSDITAPSIAELARRYHVDRKTIRRDLQEMIRRGQLPARDLPEED